jgi:hypothetical protein
VSEFFGQVYRTKGADTFFKWVLAVMKQSGNRVQVSGEQLTSAYEMFLDYIES